MNRNPVSQQQAEKPRRKGLKLLGKLLLILLETVLLLVVALYGVMYVLAKGPSPTARELFVRSVRETSAIGFLAELYLSEEEIAQIEASRDQVEEYVQTDTSLITIQQPEQQDEEGPKADAWGLVDEDGDGIILQEVKGEGYCGYMMVVLGIPPGSLWAVFPPLTMPWAIRWTQWSGSLTQLPVSMPAASMTRTVPVTEACRIP